jgi:hypothetical protein
MAFRLSEEAKKQQSQRKKQKNLVTFLRLKV